MKPFVLILTYICSLNSTVAQQIHQKDSLTSVADSSKYSSNNFTVLRSPYAHGNATFVVNNRNLFGLNAGVDVFKLTRSKAILKVQMTIMILQTVIQHQTGMQAC